MSEAVSWPFPIPKSENLPLETDALPESAEIIPPEVLEDIRLSHNICWHAGELGIGIQRIDPLTVNYTGPPNSTLLQFTSPQERRVFCDELLDDFTHTGGEDALELFPVEGNKDIWQLMTYGCDIDSYETASMQLQNDYEANRQRKKEFDDYLGSRIRANWPPDRTSNMPPVNPKTQLIAQYLLTKNDIQHF